MSVPEPKTFNGAPGEVYGDDRRETSHRVTHHCRECAWRGTSLAAFVHHISCGHHRIEVAHTGLLSQFSCCPTTGPTDDNSDADVLQSSTKA